MAGEKKASEAKPTRGLRKLNRRRLDTIVKLIEAGTPPNTAARASGVTDRAFRSWMRWGREEIEQNGKPLSLYGQLYLRVEEAMARCEQHHVMRILKAAAEGTWQASAWYLERRWPDRWARRWRGEISGPAGGPVQVGVWVDLLRQIERAGDDEADEELDG